MDDGGSGADGGFEGDEEARGNGRVGGEAIGEELEDGEDGENGEDGEDEEIGEMGEIGTKTRLCCLIACTLLAFKMARPHHSASSCYLGLLWRETRRWLERLLELRWRRSVGVRIVV